MPCDFFVEDVYMGELFSQKTSEIFEYNFTKIRKRFREQKPQKP